ncbi:uncharacterized protein LOC110368681 [Fundulus heteroclitus]|uniref:uncharacterized protein LOC110368681 n=1 Tax=Fundulus heteroclitus TaxID=8078 RepID=UPI00165CCC0C|nr:uncharacterized protein LOC110368681 [Fundulus heteroclitus]
MATEYLECKGCKKKYSAWSEDILGQLDMGHRRKFSALLTYRHSCDYRVVILMRERTQGNSVTQLHKKLEEEHSAAWTRRTLEYLAACEPFSDYFLVETPVFSAPPPLLALPKPRWLLAVYARDVLSRLPEVTKKLAGAAANTAGWCTNIGNEHGSALSSLFCLLYSPLLCSALLILLCLLLGTPCPAKWSLWSCSISWVQRRPGPCCSPQT